MADMAEVKSLIESCGGIACFMEEGRYEYCGMDYIYGCVFGWHKDLKMLFQSHDYDRTKINFPNIWVSFGKGGSSQIPLGTNEFEKRISELRTRNDIAVNWGCRDDTLTTFKESHLISGKDRAVILEAITYHRIKKHFPIEAQKAMGM